MKLPTIIKNKPSRIAVFSLVALTVVLSLYISNFVLIPSAKAFDVASQYRVSDDQAVSGDILSSDPAKGLVRSNIAYDFRLFGVINDDPLAVYKDLNADKNDRTILRSGDVTINITDYNGAIQPGDLITSSPIAGKGMKALQSGYVIGLAISTVTPGPKISFQGRQVTTGRVNLTLQIQYYELGGARSAIQLLDSINTAFFRSVQDPEKFTILARYLIAGMVAVFTSALGFFAFSRSMAVGIEAMGRNPLARRSIQTSMFMQIGLTLATTFAGVALAVIIIRL